MWILLALLAVAGPVEGPVEGDVDVDVRHARGLAQRYEVRDDGMLWVQPEGGPWSLFQGTGLVPGSARPIVAVFADEDLFFTVVTDDGGLHHFESGVFDSLWGLPTLPFTRAPLSLPFDVAQLRPGRVAYSMRHKNVLFYEDAKRRQFFWGNAGTTTLWVLSDDGRRLLLGDPWLPPDFSRELSAPHGGALKMASVAASASTLFVIGVDGSLHTRFVDYDSFGGTPFFHYDYPAGGAVDVVTPGLPGDDPASELQTRALPAEDWRSQPSPLTPGTKGRLSRRIGIRQSGVGNAARALTVVGDDDDGRRGVFTKALDDPAWRFTPDDGAVVDDDEWLDPAVDAVGAAPAMALGGWLRGDRSLGAVYGSTSDFWFHRSPFHLTLDVDGEEVRLLVHTVDAWTLCTANNAADDDTAHKLLKATLVLEDKQKLSTSTQQRLRAIFHDALGQTFAFAIVANQHELVLFPVGYPFNVARGRFELVLRADPQMRSRAVVPVRPSSRIAARFVDVAAVRSGAACGHEAERARAQTALTAVRAARAQAVADRRLAAALELGLPVGTSVADVATVLTTTRFTWDVTRWLTGFELNLPAVVGAQSVATERFLTSSQADFDDVTLALARCIAR